MAESTFIKIILALITAISAFFWFVINGLKNSDNHAHSRIDGVNEKINAQDRHNAETYARRDDVNQMKNEILNAIGDLKKDIRELQDK